MTANTPASRKAKGASFQKDIVSFLLKTFPSLTDSDVRSVPSSVPGTDIWLSSEALKKFNYDVEAKRTESFNVWAALKQCEDRTTKSKRTPLVVFKRNRSDTYCCLKFEDFLKLVEEKR